MTMDELFRRKLCTVHCGTKEGFFLGGHQEHNKSGDVYFRCSSSCCKNRRIRSCSEGGCIYTGVQFERHGGRDTSKSYKSSIVVEDANNGTRTPLGKWLETMSQQMYFDDLLPPIGSRIRVLWTKPNQYFEGTVMDYREPESGKLKPTLCSIVYDDGEAEVRAGAERMP